MRFFNKSPSTEKSEQENKFRNATCGESHKNVPCLETLHDLQSWAETFRTTCVVVFRLCFKLDSLSEKRPFKPSWTLWCPRHFANRGSRKLLENSGFKSLLLPRFWDVRSNIVYLHTDHEKRTRLRRLWTIMSVPVLHGRNWEVSMSSKDVTKITPHHCTQNF